MGKGKKFDICLMNPPYDKNLHLKFLEKVTGISNKILSIQPVRWLQDPFATKKRSTLKQYNNVAKHINSIDVLKSNTASSNFDISLYSDLGIYLLTNDTTTFDYDEYWKESKSPEQISIINKICLSKETHLSDVIEKNKIDGYRVPISLIAGGRGCLPTIKNFDVIRDGNIGNTPWIDIWNKDPKHSAFKRTSLTDLISIKFNTKEEAINFYNSYQNFIPLKGLCKLTVQQQHIQDFILPFFSNYDKPITEEWFKEHYKLTNAEMDELYRLGNLKYSDEI